MSKPLIPVGPPKKKRIIEEIEEIENINISEFEEKPKEEVQIVKQVQQMATVPNLIEFKENEAIIAEDNGLFSLQQTIKSTEIAKKKEIEEELNELIGIDPKLVNNLLKRLLGPSSELLKKQEEERKRIFQEISKPPPSEALQSLENNLYLQVGYLIARM